MAAASVFSTNLFLNEFSLISLDDAPHLLLFFLSCSKNAAFGSELTPELVRWDCSDKDNGGCLILTEGLLQGFYYYNTVLL
jgi:hypothetical protein